MLIGVLGLLVFALAAIFMVVFFGIRPAAPPPDGAASPIPPATSGAFVLPPTWTHTPTSTPQDTLAPSVTASLTPVMPSLTPFATRTPGGVSQVQPIGRTVKNQRLLVYRFGSGPRVRLVVAGTHGPDGLPGASLAERLMAAVRKTPSIIPADVTLFILPALNPDSAPGVDDLAGVWNAHGVDLNRNFAFKWSPTWDNTGCKLGQGGAGEQALSEPEAQALVEFIGQNRVEMLLHYNRSFDGVQAGGRPPSPEAAALAAAFAEAMGTPPKVSDCPVNGMLSAWAADQGILALDAPPPAPGEAAMRQNIAAFQAWLNWVVSTSPLPSYTPRPTRGPYYTPTPIDDENF